jgi:tetratricopeptide (TPR) repeat protein
MKDILKAAVILTAFILVGTEGNAASYTSLIRRGNRFYRNELYGEALTHYQAGKKKNKNALEPDFNAASAYYKLEDYVSSREALLSLIQKEKGEKRKLSDIYYNLGNSFFKLGDYQKAVDNYIKGLEITPYDLNMKFNLELALQKMESSKEQEQTQEQNKGKDGQGKGTETGGGEGEESGKDQTEEQASKGSQEQEQSPKPDEQQELSRDSISRDEAERLINSLNTAQTQTIGEIIKQRISRTENEKDW